MVTRHISGGVGAVVRFTRREERLSGEIHREGGSTCIGEGSCWFGYSKLKSERQRFCKSERSCQMDLSFFANIINSETVVYTPYTQY